MPRSKPAICWGILGCNFKVKRLGSLSPFETLHWGDVCHQGPALLRWYYSLSSPGRSIRSHHLAVDHAAAPLVDVHIGKGPAQAIFRAPWTAELPPTEGLQDIVIDSYGCRMNTFGQLHNVAAHYRWWGPASWRTSGADWSDAYHPQANGLLVAPRLLQES